MNSPSSRRATICVPPMLIFTWLRLKHRETASSVSQAPQWDAPAATDTAPAEPAVTQPLSADAGNAPQSVVPADGAESGASSEVVQPAEAAGSAAVMPAASSKPVPSPAYSVQEGSSAQKQAVPAFAALPAEEHHVEVIADAGDCWMGFEADGRKQQRFLRKGDSFTLAFRDALVMKLGDAGAVRVTYNGKELERSWIFRTVGYGHGVDFWKAVISELRLAGYDYAISIEHARRIAAYYNLQGITI